MQAITWSREEFQASVSNKLALLRANRQQDGAFNLDQRLELAQDRQAFDERQRAAQAARLLAGQPLQGLHMGGRADMSKRVGQPPLHNSSDCDLFMQRFESTGSSGENSGNDTDAPDDGQMNDSYAGKESKTAKVRPKMSGAVDSYAVSMTLKPGRPSTFVPHAVRYQHALQKAGLNSDASHPTASSSPRKPANGTPDPNYTELPSDKIRVKPDSLYAEEPKVDALLDAAQIQRRRLVEQTQRQASADWVVIDRATVLDCLSKRPEGMTMTQLVTFLLGGAASARDIRRLSALMTREAQRGTVIHAGRGNPITITTNGRAQLSAMDLEKAATAAVEKRQKRVTSQATRLILGGAPQTAQEKAATRAARAAVRVAASAGKAEQSPVAKRAVGRPRNHPLPVTVYKAGKPLPPGKPIKPSGRRKPKE